MIRRYAFAGNNYVQGVRWTGQTPVASTRVRAEFTCNLKGEAGSTVTIIVSDLLFSYSSYGFLQINGIDKAKNDTVNVTLDGAGLGSINVNIGYATGTVPDGEIAETFLKIFSATSGAIGAPDTINVYKIVGS